MEEEAKHVRGLVHFAPLCEVCKLTKEIRGYKEDLRVCQEKLANCELDLKRARMRLDEVFDKLKDAGL